MYGEIILQLTGDFQKDVPTNLQQSFGKVESYKEELNVCFKFANSGHT